MNDAGSRVSSSGPVLSRPTVADRTAPTPPHEEFALQVEDSSPRENSEGWFDLHDYPAVHNVTQPTLMPFLPAPGTATGASVLIAPGGGFMLLSVQSEGWDMAQWLADHGVAAFVLKYRLIPTPPTGGGVIEQFLTEIASSDPFYDAQWFRDGKKTAISDATTALREIRARADEFGIDPERVGMMGFSAGAFTTVGLTQTCDEQDRPTFIASVYGPTYTPTEPIPENPPPLWTAFAADAPLLHASDLGLINAWRSKGGSVEFHLHDAGGHGYAFQGAPGTTTQGWPAMLLSWLRVHGIVADD